MKDLHFETVRFIMDKVDDAARNGYESVCISYDPKKVKSTLKVEPIPAHAYSKSAQSVSKREILKGLETFLFAITPKNRKSA